MKILYSNSLDCKCIVLVNIRCCGEKRKKSNVAPYFYNPLVSPDVTAQQIVGKLSEVHVPLFFDMW